MRRVREHNTKHKQRTHKQYTHARTHARKHTHSTRAQTHTHTTHAHTHHARARTHAKMHMCFAPVKWGIWDIPRVYDALTHVHSEDCTHLRVIHASLVIDDLKSFTCEQGQDLEICCWAYMYATYRLTYWGTVGGWNYLLPKCKFSSLGPLFTDFLILYMYIPTLLFPGAFEYNLNITKACASNWNFEFSA